MRNILESFVGASVAFILGIQVFGFGTLSWPEVGLIIGSGGILVSALEYFMPEVSL